MNHFAEVIGKFSISESQWNTSSDPNLTSVKSESQRNTSSDPNSISVKSESQRNTSSDPNSISVKSETQRNSSSDPNSISLPCSLYECKCKVVVVSDFLQCGVVQLEGESRKAYCLFFGKDFLSRNELGEKLSTQISVGTILLANARLMKERSIIPFLATSIWEEGAIQGENELSKLFSHLECQEIEQYNRLSLDLQWFLPIDDSPNNNLDKDVAADNNNRTENHHDQSRNWSPRYLHNQKRTRSPGHHSQTESPSHHTRKMRSSRSPTYSSQRSRSHSSRPRHHRQTKSRSRSPTYRHNHDKDKRSKYRHSRTRSRSPRDYSGNTESMNLRYLHRQEQATESSSNKIKGKQDMIDSVLTANQDKTRITTIKHIARKVLNKKREEISQSTIQTHQLVDKRSISNGKGRILRILNSNYGIAIVLGFGRLCRVLFDIFDVWIDSQVCADLGKTLHDVTKEGDLVSLHAIFIENPPSSSTDRGIEYMATAVVRAKNMEALLSTKLPAPPSPMEVSQDKIANFHKVSKVVLDMQDDGSSLEKVMVKSMKQEEIPTDCGILWKRDKTDQHVNFFCFHCKKEHYRSQRGLKKAGVHSHRLQHPMLTRGPGRRSNGKKMLIESWKAHNQHVKSCKDSKCLEEGKLTFEKVKRAITFDQTRNKSVQQDKEFQRLKSRGSAGKRDLNNIYCLHCQYEGESMGHFASKEHQDHVRDCGTKILDCPENPELSSAVAELIRRREMLYLKRENMSSLYHRYFCLHCKEPFSDKRHIRGVNHTLHMAKESCDTTCKTGCDLLEDEKGVNGAKWCFMCNIKLGSKSSYQAHVKNSQHSDKVDNLFKKVGGHN